MLEVSVENHLRDEVKARGGLCVKLDPASNRGIPDRLVVLPGFIGFVELKRPSKGVVGALQDWWHDRLRQLGAPVVVLRTKDKVSRWVASVSGEGC